MRLTLIEWLTIGAIGAILLVMGLSAYDRIAGSKEFAESSIVAKRHIPSWVEHYTTWIPGKDLDDDGDLDTRGHNEHHTRYHPDQYLISIGIYGEQSVGFGQFSTLNVGDPVVISRTIGRFSGLPGAWSFHSKGRLQPEAR